MNQNPEPSDSGESNSNDLNSENLRAENLEPDKLRVGQRQAQNQSASSKDKQSPQILYILLCLAAFIVVIAGLKAAHSIVVPFLLALFLAVLVAPPLFKLEQIGCPRPVAFIVVFGILLVVGVGFVGLVTDAARQFSAQAQEYMETCKELIQRLKAQYPELPWPEFDMEALDPAKMLGSVFSSLVVVATGIGNALANAFLVFLITLFMLAEASVFRSKLKSLKRPHLMDSVDQCSQSIKDYMLRKAGTSLATSLLCALLLYSFGVKFVLLWAVMAFLLNFVPNLGSILAAVPPVLIGLLDHGPLVALAVGGGYVVINVVIGNVIEPRVMGKGLGLSALVAFVSLIVWGWVLGVIGMLLSIPLTVLAKIVFESFNETRFLAILMGSGAEADAKAKPS